MIVNHIPLLFAGIDGFHRAQGQFAFDLQGDAARVGADPGRYVVAGLFPRGVVESEPHFEGIILLFVLFENLLPQVFDIEVFETFSREDFGFVELVHLHLPEIEPTDDVEDAEHVIDDTGLGEHIVFDGVSFGAIESYFARSRCAVVGVVYLVFAIGAVLVGEFGIVDGGESLVAVHVGHESVAHLEYVVGKGKGARREYRVVAVGADGELQGGGGSSFPKESQLIDDVVGERFRLDARRVLGVNDRGRSKAPGEQNEREYTDAHFCSEMDVNRAMHRPWV